MEKIKKKVGIITLPGYFNYGNRLQNYALQEVVKEFGFEVETLVINRIIEKEAKKNKIKRFLKLSVRDKFDRLYNKFVAIFRRVKLYNFKKTINERTNQFKKFSAEYLNERYCKNSYEELQKIEKDFAYFITGSDQVWNPYFTKTAEYAYYLTFTDVNKRIAYAASFGLNELPSYYKVMIKPWLNQLKAISVRENSGADIVRELTGRKAIVSLDPTLLLSKEKWLSIAKEAPKPNNKFILTYFLGDKPDKATNLISDIIKEYNYEVVNLADMKDKKVYSTGPQEFIDYFYSAEVILTDSFHGCVFSILMEKPFVVFDRLGSHNMYSRVETLLSLLNLNKREVSQIIDLKDLFEIDFTQVRSILQKEREKANDYLKKALDLQ